jgi:hypothetical protein
MSKLDLETQICLSSELLTSIVIIKIAKLTIIDFNVVYLVFFSK